VLNTATSGSISEGEGVETPTPSNDKRGAAEKNRKFLLASNLPLQIRGSPRREPGLTREKELRRRVKQAPPP
jgi:hypothetical protein